MRVRCFLWFASLAPFAGSALLALGCGGVEDGGLFGVSVGPPLGAAGGDGGASSPDGSGIDLATPGSQDSDGAAPDSSKPSAPTPDANKGKDDKGGKGGDDHGDGSVDAPHHGDAGSDAGSGPGSTVDVCKKLAACCATLADSVQHQCALVAARSDSAACTTLLRGLCSGGDGTGVGEVPNAH